MAEDVSHGANEIEQLSGEAAAAASDTSAATEEQLAVNQEISSSAQTLSKLAEDLQVEMKTFQSIIAKKKYESEQQVFGQVVRFFYWIGKVTSK